MQLADLTIEPSQEEIQRLVCTYEDISDAEGTVETAVAQFEHACLKLLTEGWQLKRVSHRGSIVAPYVAIVAIYEK